MGFSLRIFYRLRSSSCAHDLHRPRNIHTRGSACNPHKASSPRPSSPRPSPQDASSRSSPVWGCGLRHLRSGGVLPPLRQPLHGRLELLQEVWEAEVFLDDWCRAARGFKTCLLFLFFCFLITSFCVHKADGFV